MPRYFSRPNRAIAIETGNSIFYLRLNTAEVVKNQISILVNRITLNANNKNKTDSPKVEPLEIEPLEIERMQEVPAGAHITPELPKIISFDTLSRCGDEIWIENNGQIYRLRRTKQGKLILTK